jgi:hypothetical protein
LNNQTRGTKIEMCHFLGANFYSKCLQTKTLIWISSDDFSDKPIQTRISKVQNEK